MVTEYSSFLFFFLETLSAACWLLTRLKEVCAIKAGKYSFGHC
jgi:hypothetical protein